jgi:hypothetical protein
MACLLFGHYQTYLGHFRGDYCREKHQCFGLLEADLQKILQQFSQLARHSFDLIGV